MNMFYTNVRVSQRMPSTWQSWLLRIATFIAIAAGSWYTMLKNFSALGLSDYASMLQTVGNTGLMLAVSYVFYAAIVYLLYALFAKVTFVSMTKQLFFFDEAMSLYDYRKILDVAVIALCVFKALMSVVYMAYPLYESMIRAVLHPLAAACAFGGALFALIIKVGKQNKEAIICPLAILFCLPLIFA